VRIRIAALAVVLVLPACSAQSPEPVAEAQVASHELAVSELDNLVVPDTDIGGLPQGLRVTNDSGWTSNRAEAASSLDPNDSVRSLRRAGRLKGYELIYEDPTEAAIRSGTGTLTVMTWVELFRSEQAASAFLQESQKRARSFAGRSPRQGVTFGAVSAFDVRVADGAYGLREVGTFGGDRLYRTLVSFRRGRVLAGSMYVRTDDQDATGEALRLAGVLDARIHQALMGGLDEEPVQIPKAGVQAGTGQQPAVQPPAGSPDLAALGLSPSDLPPGTASDTGEYTFASPPRFKFRRDFFLQGATIGRSRIVQMVNEVGAFESSTAASASVALTAQGLAAPEATKAFAANLAATGGLQARHLRRHRVKLPHGAVGYVTTFDTDLGRLVDFYAIAHRGRGTTSLEVLAAAKGFRYQDLVPLLQKVERRLGRLR
jgi:hypothetical protein